MRCRLYSRILLIVYDDHAQLIKISFQTTCFISYCLTLSLMRDFTSELSYVFLLLLLLLLLLCFLQKLPQSMPECMYACTHVRNDPVSCNIQITCCHITFSVYASISCETPIVLTCFHDNHLWNWPFFKIYHIYITQKRNESNHNFWNMNTVDFPDTSLTFAK